jgi:2-oxoglutarate dehydrogenase E2 component (dihydrolipoamide succinyltransferase)
MKMDIKIPEVGESVYEALVAKWLRNSGDMVIKDEPLCELETDKITIELAAQVSGVLTITVPSGQTVKIGTVIGLIAEKEGQQVVPPEAPVDGPSLSPAVRKIAAEKGIDTSGISGSGRGGRVTVGDLQQVRAGEQGPGADNGNEPVTPLSVRSEEPVPYLAGVHLDEDTRVTRVPMTPIRRRIAERLVAVRQQTAMLTTFNESDLSRIVDLRNRHKEQFLRKHGTGLGFMSFFVKACCEALNEFPLVNASIDGNDIIYHNFFDIGIAIGAEKGLVVPVLRDANKLHFHEIEQQIVEFGQKVKEHRIAIADLEGGTFTISNGGVYGSLLSTPILNPPQCAVLGMHAIQDRPVVREGQIVIRPMMYLALSYDHRIIDGREAVGFLKRVKEYVEEPEELFLEG